MKNQEQFPTIWDTPLKAAKVHATREKAIKPQASAFKEMFLTIWDSSKIKTAS
ncbi:hypothetical protein [Vreelandella aquamarina]|uniref:hypothetical protein n=1 Tax=Vreelandella aquamarina TaxID=77097 RepID=UPI00385000B1